MPKTHPPYVTECRGQVVELVFSGRTAGGLAREFECSVQTIRNWVRQAERDEGCREDGLRSTEFEELRRHSSRGTSASRRAGDMAKSTACFVRETDSVPVKSSNL